MNNDLIKRIDDYLSKCLWITRDGEVQLLHDCRAEIERLSQSNECLRNQNTALDEILAEYSERKYVPMTDDEISQMMQDWYNDTSDETSLSRFIETAVIKRLGLEIKQ